MLIEHWLIDPLLSYLFISEQPIYEQSDVGVKTSTAQSSPQLEVAGGPAAVTVLVSLAVWQYYF